jgi:glucose-6-phosphate 1-dehydrogenase
VFDLDIPKHHNAYEGVIRHALANEMDYFVDIREVYALWRCTDTVIEGLHGVPLVYYKKGEGPNFTNNI